MSDPVAHPIGKFDPVQQALMQRGEHQPVSLALAVAVVQQARNRVQFLQQALAPFPERTRKLVERTFGSRALGRKTGRFQRLGWKIDTA